MEPEVRVAENLSETTERRAEWFHFHAAEGLPRLQRASLEKAELTELHFNRRARLQRNDTVLFGCVLGTRLLNTKWMVLVNKL